MAETVKKFLEGFGGRVILMVIGGVTALAISVGGWYAKRVGDGVDHANYSVSALATEQAKVNGDKISRAEFDSSLRQMREEVRAQRDETNNKLASVDTKLSHLIELLVSKTAQAQN